MLASVEMLERERKRDIRKGIKGTSNEIMYPKKDM